MGIFLFILFGAFMTYLIYKWKRKPMGGWPSKPTSEPPPYSPPQKDLSAQQIQRISILQKALVEVNDTSLAETLNNFRKDLNPDSEIEIWEAIAGAYQQTLLQKPTASLEEKHEVYRLLLLRSSMSAEEALVQAKVSILSEAAAKEVLDLYNLAIKPILISS